MSLLGFGIGVRALLTAQSRLETVGHNLANASTPGYSRQNVLVSAATPQSIGGLFRGGGVQADAIRRAVDQVLNGRLAQQDSSLGRLDTNIDAFTQAEALLGGLSESGPAKLFERMFENFAALSSSADDGVLRSSAVRSADTLAGRLNQVAGSVQSLSRTVSGQIDAAVEQVNQLSARILDLNRRIQDTEIGNATANDLHDLRDQAIRELSSYVDVHAIEDEQGGLRVLVEGRMLVSPNTRALMSVQRDPSGAVTLQISDTDVAIGGGRIGGLLTMAQSFLPKLASDVDDFARSLIYETNRVHATGVGLAGPFQTLQGSHALTDQNGDGNVDDELLADAGLPFQVQSGELVMLVTDRATGQVDTHRLPIDAARTTVGAFVAQLDGLPHVSAQLDVRGHLQIQADSGYGFDFSARLDAAPDRLGSFGSGHASIVSAGQEPFALAAGDTLDITGPLGTFSLAFQAGDFANDGAATAAEVATALNANANFTASGLRANTVGGALVVQTVGVGATQGFTLQGGSALGGLGWSAGQVVAGSDVDVAPQISGAYTGAANGAFVFRPNMDGAIGTTAGLVVEVFDAGGNKITDLQVGAGYHPGDELEVADGVKVAFGYGQLSASEHDQFRLDVVADSDSARVLPALGLNGFFDGLDASSISVRDDILANPALFATSRSGAVGDATNLLDMIAAGSRDLVQLGGATLDERFSDIVGEVGFELQSSSDARDAEQLALDSLETRREQISGVNTDEELVSMIEQQQAYAAAAQFLRVVNDVTSELMNIL